MGGVAETGPEPKQAGTNEEAEGTALKARPRVRVGAPDTQTDHHPEPARSTGSSGRGRGYVPTDTIVHGGTTSLQGPATTATLQQSKQKKMSEKLTSLTLY